jgi:S1-C subfamily serine protease
MDAPARAALVNILCMPQSGSLRPISGSGVIIDPRGVILTNAHVAQYVLLSESPQINLVCNIRTSSPASPHWKAVVLYIPQIWVDSHYQLINSDHISGTGEHDYALLYIVSDTQGNPVTASFPYLPVETRENVAFQGDNVLVAGYPAEFVGGIAAQQNLYAATSPSTIKQLLTFNTSTVDVFNVGGVIEAQGGSSGGPVINAWRHIVGIIVTTSEGSSTASRDLHALSLNYIERDLVEQTTKGLNTILSGDVAQLAQEFSLETAHEMVQKYIDFLTH